MPELPEIVCRAREMEEELVGRRIRSIDVLQPKCLNVSVDAFERGLLRAEIQRVTPRGKWLCVETSNGHLLLNLGMGGELLLMEGESPGKWRLRFGFEDGEALYVNFWWIGNAHYASPGRLDEHPPTAKLGPGALDLRREEFAARLAGRRGAVKTFLLDQSRIAGIGNAYIHDILFRARLHPLRKIPTLSRAEIDALHTAIREELGRSIEAGGAWYEVGLRGQRGGFTAGDLLVGYRDGKTCPVCGGTIEKLKTGATTSYVCPCCQPPDGRRDPEATRCSSAGG